MNKIVKELTDKAVSNFEVNKNHECIFEGVCAEFSALFLMELFIILAKGDAPLTVKQMQVINKHFKSGVED